MANRRFTQFFNTLHTKPVLLDCNWVVDSGNANGLGIKNLKGPGIQNVYMQSLQAAPGPNGAAGALFNGARSYAVLGASAVSNTGSSVLTGNLGIYPGTAVSGFPPGTFSGVLNATNAAALNAQSSAQAAYTALQALTPTTIATALDGQSLTPGVYKAASGTFSLAASAGGTLTLTGTASDVFVFQTNTTLVTGAGGVPVITLAGGLLAQNIYWVVGSSATINSGSAGVFNGNVLAQASVTDTLGGTVNGSLVALTGAVTLSAASIINAQTLKSSGAVGNPNPGPGVIVVQLQDNYNRYYGGFSQQVSALGTSVSSVVSGVAYVITSLGTATLAQWVAKGLPLGMVPAVGVSFIASASGSIGGSALVAPSQVAGSGIDHIEVLGDPNLTINSSAPVIWGVGSGAYIVYQSFSNGVIAAPVDGSTIYLGIYLSSSSIMVQGE